MPLWSVQEWRARIGTSWCAIGRPIKSRASCHREGNYFRIPPPGGGRRTESYDHHGAVTVVIMTILLILAVLSCLHFVLAGYHLVACCWFVCTPMDLLLVQWMLAMSLVSNDVSRFLSKSWSLLCCSNSTGSFLSGFEAFPSSAGVHRQDCRITMTCIHMKKYTMTDEKIVRGIVLSNFWHSFYGKIRSIKLCLSSAVVKASLLLRCGDVEMNPGPLTKDQVIDFEDSGVLKHLGHITDYMYEWEGRIAEELGLTQDDIDAIKSEYCFDSSLQRRAALRMWKEKQGSNATYDKLIHVFEASDYKSCADIIRRILHDISGDSEQSSSDVTQHSLIISDQLVDFANGGVLKHLGEIADFIYKWEGRIADELGLTPYDVNTIKTECPGRLHLQMIEALRMWKQKQGSNATYDNLINAFERAGRMDCADKIRLENHAVPHTYTHRASSGMCFWWRAMTVLYGWEKRIAEELGLTSDEIHAVKTRHLQTIGLQMRAVLRMWKDKHDSNATYGNLIRMFDHAGRVDCAEEIRRIIHDLSDTTDDSSSPVNQQCQITTDQVVDFEDSGVLKHLGHITDYMYEWEGRIAEELRLTQNEIDEIKSEYCFDSSLQRRAALEKWKQKQDFNATYDNLICVFEAAGYNRCADVVRRIISESDTIGDDTSHQSRTTLEQVLDFANDGTIKYLGRIADTMYEWERRISKEMGLTADDVDAIKTMCPNSLSRQSRAALRMWKEKQGSNATYGNLVHVFERAGRMDCAEAVRRTTDISESDTIGDNISQQSRTISEQALDFANGGASKHLGQIAETMYEWEGRIPKEMGLTADDVDAIKTMYPNCQTLQSRAALRMWKERQGSNATYGNLIRVFDRAGRMDCAEEVRRIMHYVSDAVHDNISCGSHRLSLIISDQCLDFANGGVSKHLGQIAESMYEWEGKIAEELGLTQFDICAIKTEDSGRTSLQNYTRAALQRWKDRQGSNATYDNLIRVFERANMFDLASNVTHIYYDIPDHSSSHVFKPCQYELISDQELDFANCGVSKHLGQIADSMYEWEGRIADELGLKSYEVLSIKTMYPGSLCLQTRAALRIWQQRQAFNATYDNLMFVFVRAKHLDLSDVVRQVYLGAADDDLPHGPQSSHRDQVISSEHLHQIADFIDEWEGSIAEQLELTLTDIKTIEDEHPNQPKSQSRAALENWKQKKDTNATYASLICSFKRAHYNNLADKVERICHDISDAADSTLHQVSHPSRIISNQVMDFENDEYLCRIADFMNDWEGYISDEMHLDQVQIAAIKTKYPRKPKLQQREALRMWKQKHGFNATYDSLVGIFERSGHIDYAEKLRKINHDISGVAGELDKALNKGAYVTLHITKVLTTGAATAGKTCTKHYIFDKPPPDQYTSTDLFESMERHYAYYTAVVDADNPYEWKIATLMDTLGMVKKYIHSDNCNVKFDDDLGFSTEELNEVRTSMSTLLTTDNEEVQPEPQTRSPVIQSDAIKKLLDPKLELSGEILNVRWIHFVDGGGQSEFLELLPALVSNVTVTIYVLDLTKTPNDFCNDHFTVNDRPQGTRQTCLTAQEMFKRFFKMVISQKDDEKCKVMIVGTHYNCSEAVSNLKKWNNFTKVLCEEYDKEGKVKIIRTSTNDNIHAIDTKGDNQYQITSKDMRMKLAECCMQRKVAIADFLIEEDIKSSSLAQKHNGILSYTECKEITQRYATENTLKKALQYFHELNEFLFFQFDGSDGLVFTKPGVLVRVVSMLIKVANHCRGNSSCLIKFWKSGIISETDLKEVFDYSLPNDKFDIVTYYRPNLFEEKELLSILQSLFIVATYADCSAHFIPCVLPPCSGDGDINECTSKFIADNPPLFITFSGCSIPRGLFCGLVTYLMDKCGWKIRLGNDQNYRTLIEFEVPEKYKLVLVEDFKVIRIHLARKARRPVCLKARKDVAAGVEAVSKKFYGSEDDNIVNPNASFNCSCLYSTISHIATVVPHETETIERRLVCEKSGDDVPFTKDHFKWLYETEDPQPPAPPMYHTPEDQASFSHAASLGSRSTRCSLSTQPPHGYGAYASFQVHPQPDYLSGYPSNPFIGQSTQPPHVPQTLAQSFSHIPAHLMNPTPVGAHIGVPNFPLLCSPPVFTQFNQPPLSYVQTPPPSGQQCAPGTIVYPSNRWKLETVRKYVKQGDGTDVVHGITGDGIVIAILDGRPDFGHLSMRGKDYHLSKSFIHSQVLTYDQHGTAVAAVAGGVPYRSNEHYNIPDGIAPCARLLICEVFYNRQSYNVDKALEYLLKLVKEKVQIDIICMAFAMDVCPKVTGHLSALAQAGVVCVAAAGNDGAYQAGPAFPASSVNVLSVGALTPRGKSDSDLNPPHGIDVYAPGEKIVVPEAQMDPSRQCCNAVTIVDGTSYAASIVAGFLALFMQCIKNQGADQILFHDIDFFIWLFRDSPYPLCKDLKLVGVSKFLEQLHNGTLTANQLVEDYRQRCHPGLLPEKPV